MNSKKVRKELKALEICFRKNGYSKKLIKELKHHDGGRTKRDYIYNLEEERSCWEA
jgi:hypothetical protein